MQTEVHWHKHRLGLKARKLILLLETAKVPVHLIGQASSKLTFGSWKYAKCEVRLCGMLSVK